MEVKTRVAKIVRPYTEDYAGWIEDTAAAIEEGRFDEIDRAALADEVRNLGITTNPSRQRDKRAAPAFAQDRVSSREADAKLGSYDPVQRKHLAKFCGKNPSLRREPPEFVEDAYGDAPVATANETDLGIDVFPETCEWTVAELLGDLPGGQ